MHIGVKGICRGDGRIYIRVYATYLPSDHSLQVTNKTKEGDTLPCRLYHQKDHVSKDRKSYIIVLPLLDIPKQNLTFSEVNADGEIVSSYNKVIGMKRSKWESRFSYRFKKKLTKGIRDFDAIGTYEQVNIDFWEIIQDTESNILRGLILLPYEEDSEIVTKCFTSFLDPVEVDLITINNTRARSAIADDVYLREIQFSVRIPHEVKNYLFTVTDEKHPEYDNFLVLENHQYERLLRDNRNHTLNAQLDSDYTWWLEAHQADIGTLAKQRNTFFEERPTFSIIVPLFKTPIAFFTTMVDSVVAQTYGRWELILVNASTEDELLSAKADSYAEQDTRIRIINLEQNLGITLNTYEGIKVATGDFVSFFDHDDVLEPDTLFEYAKAVNEFENVDLLYCDEDKLMPDNTYCQPFFKPDFSPDLLRNNNYICHLLTIRKSILDELDASSSEYDGAQDHHLTLQASEKARYIHHVPRILYHWRISESSTAGDAESKPYASEAGIKAVQAQLDRLGVDGKVTLSRRPFTYKVEYALPEKHPLVSIIIPNKDNIDILDVCVRSVIEKTTYDRYEIVIIENNSTDEKTFEYYEELEKEFTDKVRIVHWSHEFNFSKLMNYGVEKSIGDYFILLNNDTELLTPNWIEIMLGICLRPEVGVVGVKLYYKDETIQHAGVSLTGTVAGCLHRNLPKNDWGYFALADATQNLSAVTAACMMTKRSVYEAVNGFSEELAVAFNDLDYCLKVREKDKLVVYTPEVELFHYESLSRGFEDNKGKQIRFRKEVAFMNYRWATYYTFGDPYMNPNFDTREPFNCYYKIPK